MKLSQLCASALVLALSCSLAGAQAQKSPTSTSDTPAAEWKQIPIPPLHPFHPQEPRRFELPNGLVVFLQEDHELPMIDGSIRIRGGSRDEPAEKVGLVEIYADVWRTG